jgi:hypothetical protein
MEIGKYVATLEEKIFCRGRRRMQLCRLGQPLQGKEAFPYPQTTTTSILRLKAYIFF